MALLRAATAGNLSRVNDLLTAGADSNEQNQWGSTSLHLASTANNTQIAKQLLTASANPTIQNANGKTPADLASTDEMHALFASTTRVKSAAI